MTRIALITTGKAEYLGLATSLQRVFPDVQFFATAQPHSFTSSRLSHPAPTSSSGRGLADQIARLVVGAVDVGKKKDRADFAIAIEDLELANRDQPQVVVQLFADAVRRHLDSSWSSLARRERAERNAREKCSFHLFVPMLESYLFADSLALQRAGVVRAPLFPLDIDLEQFETADHEFVKSFTSEEEATRFRSHPKRYLKYLSDGDYRESRQGRRALEGLDWAIVLRHPARVRFLRSLFADIADMIGVENSFPGEMHPLTWCPGAPGRILRNVTAAE